MFGEKLMIKKYPYLGSSPNLIEYFGIIGYSEDFIPELISTIKNNASTQSCLKNINQYPPTILSSITSQNDYGIIDNELIINQIYPDNPKIILCENNQPEPEKSNVIYSFCFDSMDGRKKVFYTCFGFKFYEIYKEGEDKYYIPKAFCIISQYSFFNAFYIICSNLYDIILEKNNLIPIEILIYNIINYIPSPINNKLDLYLFNNENEESKIELNLLNGFPNLDFDLFEIFNLLPLNLILEIYILTFLEINILFFSSNLEILNIIMYIMFMFNYPCNDSIYFWHIVSVGKSNLIESNKFVGKVMSSLLGVNCSYDSCIETKAFSSYHYIIDIDNKKIIFKETYNMTLEDREDANKLNNFVNYIENILKEKTVNSNVLKIPLHKLKNRIENYLNEKIIGFSTYPKKNFVNFFKKERNQKNNNINLKILEFFYDCTLSLLTNFYNDNQLTSSFDKIIKEENNINEVILKNSKYFDEEEKYFFELFRSTVKYKIYFENFLSEFEVVDVFKIPFLFSRVFLELKMKDDEEISCDNLEYFSIINHLYRLNNNQNFAKKINFNNFNQLYLESMDKYFKRFFRNDNLLKNQEEGKIYMPVEKKQKLIKLNKKIINRYIYLVQNFVDNDEIENIYPLIKKRENMEIKSFDRRIIYELIKNKLIEKKFISSLNFLIYSMTYVISLTITLHPFKLMISYLGKVQEAFTLIKYLRSHYIYILIKSIYKYYIINKETFKYPSMNLTHIKMYFYFLANFIRSQLILPNEEIMFILKSFFSDIIFKERKEINYLDELKKTKIEEEQNSINNNSFDEKQEFVDVKKSNSFIIFIKYCFNGKRMFKSKVMIERAMLELESTNMIIKIGDKVNYPQILIKINNYIYKCKLYTPYKLFKESENIFEELFDNYDLDISFVDINKLRDIITNLIIYGKELKNSKIPVDYLVNTLYIIRNFENKNPIDKEK